MPLCKWLLLILLVGAIFSTLTPQVCGETIIVRSTYSMKDDTYGWYHVYGEVNISSAAPYNYSIRSISYTFNYNDGSPSDTITTPVLLDLVGDNPPYNATPFHVILANATKANKVSSYSFAGYDRYPSGNYPYRGFTDASSLSVTGGKCKVNGTVTNSGGTSATYVQVVASFYNGTRVVYADWTYVSGMHLSAGSLATFEIVASNKTQVTGYRLQFQCCEYEKPLTSGDTPDFFLRSIPPIAKSVTQGGSQTYELRFIPNSLLPYANPVTLTSTGQPSGSTVSFSPNTFVPSQPTNITMTATPSTAIGVGIGDFQIVVSASNGLKEHNVPVILTVSASSDFELTVSPPSSSVSQGNQATYTVTARSGGGFSSAVTLNYSNIPTGSTASFDSNPIVPTSGGTTTTFRISTSVSTELGTKIFTVCGSGGSPVKSHCVAASVTVTASTTPRFTLSVTPADRTVMRNSFTTFTVTVGSVNSFNSPVSLSVSGLPAGTIGVFSLSSVTPASNGTVQSTLNITTTSDPAYGTYTITVTGSSSGYTSQSVQATLTVSSLTEPDFAVYLLPAALSIVRNNSGTTTIQVVSINGFDGSVTLTLENIPTGVSHTIANPTVAPLAGGYVYTKLTLQATSSSSAGSYTLTLRGTGSSRTHNASLGLQITNRTSIGKCIVATATYGSEFSPEVQFLREFRDGRVLSTSAGKEFMKAFDAWYYSFSPQLASWLVTSPSTREIAKVFLAPLLGILHLSEISYSALGSAPEVAVTFAGLTASSLIGMVYFGPILAIGSRRISRRSYARLLVWVSLACVVSLLLMSIGLALFVSPLVMLTSSTLVLSTMTLGSLLVPLTISSMLRLR